MKPAPFGYHRVSSVEEAVATLGAYEGAARPIAGGQSLVPMLNMRLLRPDALVDINPVGSLRRIDVDGATGAVTIGATTRYRAIEASDIVAERLPLLARVIRHVGDRQVRNRGTVGGSLSHGDPTAEVPLACLTLGGTVQVQGPDGVRAIRAEELYETSYASVLAPWEVLTEVVIPEGPAHSGFLECCRRHNDFAVVSVACVGDRDRSGRWTRVRVGLGGVADTPVLAADTARILEGSQLTDADIREAAEAALAVIDPPSDIRASAEYRRHLVPIYVRRALTDMRRGADARDGSSSDGSGR